MLSTLLLVALSLTTAFATQPDVVRQARHRRVATELDARNATRTTIDKRACAPTYTNSETISGTAGLVKPSTWLTRSGAQLFLNGQTFRPVGPNIFWLGLAQDPTVAYPSKGQVREALAAAVAMGANTVRCITCGVSVGNPLSVWPTANNVNQNAFDSIDMRSTRRASMACAFRFHLGTTMIIFMGASTQCCVGREHHKTTKGAAFYTDTKTINLYLQYINTILTHVNKYTGVALKDDPTCAFWETGNEWGAYGETETIPSASWTNSVAQKILSLSPKSIVVDGTDGTRKGNTDNPGFNVAGVGAVTDHFYGNLDSQRVWDGVGRGWQYSKHFTVGEFDWTGSRSSLQNFLSVVEQQGVAGSMAWSLFGHDDQCCNYIQHNDGYSLLYPSGNTATLQNNILTVVQHWYCMTGRSVPNSLPAVRCPQPEF